MRIVLACIRYPPAPGGAESHVAALAEGFAKRGHEVVVHTSDLFTEYPFARKALPPKVEGVSVVRHRAFSPGRLAHYVFLPTMGPALRKAAKRADALHAHSYGYYPSWATMLAARGARKPWLFTPHYHPPWSMEGARSRRALRDVYDKAIGQRVLDSAARVIAVSTGELAELKRHMRVDDARVRVIPNGFHASRFTPTPDPAPFRRLVGGEPFVLFAGRLAKNKGLDTLVRAVPMLPADARVVLAGEDQGQRAGLEKLARELGVQDRLRFTGHLTDELYRSALAAADVLALPSEWEAFGIVLAEAMACGTPVVATSVGGAPDVVGDGAGGVLVPYGDPARLADALSRVLTDRAGAHRMGAAGKERAFRLFSWDAVVERTLELYAEVAREKA